MRFFMNPWSHMSESTLMSWRRLAARIRIYRMRSRRFLFQHVLHANDPPHRLALGCAIGIFVMFTPTLGIQSFLVVAIAWLMRANKIIGLPVLWISNPATVVPIYGACYWVGLLILGSQGSIGDTWRQLESNSITGPPISFWWNRLMDFAAPLWIGGIILGLISAVPSYYLVLWGVNAYRRRNKRCET